MSDFSPVKIVVQRAALAVAPALLVVAALRRAEGLAVCAALGTGGS